MATAATLPLRLSREILVSLREDQKCVPLQGLLLGSRTVTPQGVSITATRSIPLDRCGQSMATLINCFLSDGNETVIGWFLILDKECHLFKVASVYFESFFRQYIRTIVANTPTPCDQNGLALELLDVLVHCVGLVAVRDANGEFVAKEYCAYNSAITLEKCISLINEQAVTELDLLSGAVASQLPHYEDMDAVCAKATNELLDQLRAEELDSPDTLANITDDLNAISKGVRKTRRRRASISIQSESFADGGFGPSGRDNAGKLPRRLKTSSLKVCQVEIVAGCGSQFVENLAYPGSFPPLHCLPALIREKEEKIAEHYGGERVELYEYEQACQEYELLALVYKILSQSNEVILRKLASIEDYEDRMKKLGAKLKHSLSPEDLLRTLASIQGSTSATITATATATATVTATASSNSSGVLSQSSSSTIPELSQ